MNADNNKINKTILVVGPAWIGDMIMAQTLFKYLKDINKDTIIDVLAPKWTIPLVERMPEVRAGITLPLGHGEFKLKQRYLIGAQLRAAKYDQAIVLPGSFKAALAAFFAKIPLRTGWFGEWRLGVLNDIRLLKEKKLPKMIERFVALGCSRRQTIPASLEPYFPALQTNTVARQQLLEKLQLTTDRPILALCPGAEYGPAKRWPAKYYAAVANKKLQEGWQVWLFGSPKEAELAASIDSLVDNKTINLAGKTQLIEAVDLLTLANAVICNDSGLMHVVAAIGRPMVVLYGSSSPRFTPPLSKKVAIVNLELECSPCFKRECPLQHFNCMNTITPELVLTKLNTLLSHD